MAFNLTIFETRPSNIENFTIFCVSYNFQSMKFLEVILLLGLHYHC